MRVTTTMLADRALAALHAGLARIARSQAHLATGRRLEVPSDDPAAHAVATRLGARLAATEQFQRQALRARETLAATDTLVDGLLTLLGRAEELAVAGANGTLSAADRAAMAVEVDQLLEEVVALANTADADRYLLGGRETTTAPLTVTRDASGRIIAATWNPRGVDGAIDLDIADGTAVQTNLGGTAVLGADTDPAFLPAVLVQLRDALSGNDQAAVNARLGPLETARARLLGARGALGSRLQRVDAVLAELDTTRLAAQTALSAVVDADIGRLAVELAQQEAVYRAALHAAARTVQPSLLEFLR